MERNIIGSLMDLPDWVPGRRSVELPRLGLVFLLEEVGYNALVQVRREPDAQIHLILKSVRNHPGLRQEAWYRDKMGCPTPVDALKKLLRMGEVEKLCRVIDQLNGYAPGSVSVLSEDEMQGAAIEAAVEELSKN